MRALAGAVAALLAACAGAGPALAAPASEIPMRPDGTVSQATALKLFDASIGELPG